MAGRRRQKGTADGSSAGGSEIRCAQQEPEQEGPFDNSETGMWAQAIKAAESAAAAAAAALAFALALALALG